MRGKKWVALLLALCLTASPGRPRPGIAGF